jgi:DNA ligase-1
MAAVDFATLVAMQDLSARADGSMPPPPSPKAPAAPKALPPVMVVQDWDWKSDPTGWWASEKYDGCRAWWDGKNLVSRRGNVYGAPDWFKAHLPRIVLDGELWLGRGLFPETVGLSRGGSPEDWKRMHYRVFDAPAAPGSFEQRLVLLHTEVQLAGFECLSVVEQHKISSTAHLLDLLDAVEKENGEGLVLRRPGSLYVAGDSTDAQKVVRVKTAEAVIIGHTRGTGNRTGGCGALVCRLPNGTEFKVGTGLKWRDVESPPPVGTTITFGFKLLTKDGVPREPRFIRVRDDL